MAGAISHAANVGADGSARQRRGVQVATGAYLLWGFLTIYWKQLGAFDALELIGWRMVSAAAVMAVVVTWRRTWPVVVGAMSSWHTLRFLLLAAGLLTVNWGSYVWAVTNDRVIETALGYFLAPLATMILGVVVLHETPTPAQRFAFACAAIAVVVLSASYGRPPWVALLLAGSWSFYGLVKRHVDLGAVDSLAGETFVLLLPAIVFLALVSGNSASVVQGADARQWVFVAGTGVITALPLAMFAWAAKAIPFTLLGPLNLIVPVVNFGLGWLLYDEPMPASRLFGFAFVWIALIAVMWDRLRAGRRPVTLTAG